MPDLPYSRFFRQGAKGANLVFPNDVRVYFGTSLPTHILFNSTLARGQLVGDWDLPSGVQIFDNADHCFGTDGDSCFRFSTAPTADALVLGLDNTSQHFHITDLAAIATAFTNGASTDPTVFLHSNTTPITDYLSIGGHDGSNATIACFGGGLVLDSVDAMELQIGAVGLLQFDDSAISGFAAGTDTAGQDVYIETQDAGATPTDVRNSGLFNLRTGAGATAASSVDGGPSGQVTIGSGSPGDATGTGNAGQSGAVLLQSAIGGAHTGGGAGGRGGGSGGVTLRSLAGGATSNVGADDAGGSGTATLGTGNGGAASAGSGDGGNAGVVNLLPGTGGTSDGGTAGIDGDVRIGGGTSRTFIRRMTRSTIANAGTVTVAQIRSAILYQDASGGSVTMTLPTGTLLDAAFVSLSTGHTIPLYLASNHASNTSTISGATGTTLVGSGAVTETGGQFLVNRTGTNAFDVVRVG